MDKEALEGDSEGRGYERAFQGKRITSVNPQKGRQGGLILYMEIIIWEKIMCVWKMLGLLQVVALLTIWTRSLVKPPGCFEEENDTNQRSVGKGLYWKQSTR